VAARSRLLLARSFAAALRSATRPGAPSMGERFSALPRLLRAVRSGQYGGMTTGRLAMMAAAAAYIVSPVDLMPEGFLAVFGLADDAMVLSWLAATVLTETESFLAWEKQATHVPGAVAFAPASYGPR